jgi:hypothetical protein
VAELVDALDSKSSSFESAGSIPARGTKVTVQLWLFVANVSGELPLLTGKYRVSASSDVEAFFCLVTKNQPFLEFIKKNIVLH